MSYDWKHAFRVAVSPYQEMFRAGVHGIPITDIENYWVHELGRTIFRQKDTQSWEAGYWHYLMKTRKSVLDLVKKPEHQRNKRPTLQMNFEDFDTLPQGWNGTERRWFPCNEKNIPQIKWGYEYLDGGYKPDLSEKEVALSLAPTGWIGQNLYAQPFIVIDIDGVGHGETDEQVIAFGRKYSDYTETWEAEEKLGSFHLYFATNRIIPIQHYSYAKLDVMGNEKNAAVYMKNKQSNGLPRQEFTAEIWNDLKAYILQRKQQREEEVYANPC